jgi:catechol 2,3-dioxygenase-like lactoylglutathione lyase family enzyme
MLDHIGLAVADYARSKAFFTAALKPLGLGPLMEFPNNIGFGEADVPYFWIGANGASGTATHVAFTAKDRATVDAFYRAALAAGGKDNGAPGLRPYLESRSEGFALHFDVDVMDFPAVDVRHANGLDPADAFAALAVFLSSPKCVALVVSEFNTELDPDETHCNVLVDGLVRAFSTALDEASP